MVEPTSDVALARQALWLLDHPEELEKRRVRFGNMDILNRYLVPMLGELVLVGAEQGTGKTTFIHTLMTKAAESGKRCMSFLLEDSHTETRFRVLSSHVGVAAHLLKNGEFHQSVDDLRSMVESCPELPLTWVEHEHKLGKIIDVVRETKDLQVVSVDYLQMLDGHRGEDRRNQVRIMIGELQAIARERQILLIVASQIVRPESRKIGERPTRHHLKEAGDIADQADKIVLLWRDQQGGGPTNICIDKDKSGFGMGKQWELQLDLARSLFVEVRGGH